MNIFSLIFKEIRRRIFGFLLACGAVALATAGVVYATTINVSFNDSMRRITLSMGTNILITPDKVDANAVWAGETGTVDMDQKLVEVLAQSTIPADHYVGKLQVKLDDVEGQRVVLTGQMREIGAVGKKKKKPMGWDVPRGECYLGSALAERLGGKGKPGATVQVMGRDFAVTRVLKPTGPVADVRLYVNIADAQELFNRPGKINAIDALGCLCPIDESGRPYLTNIERRIEEHLNTYLRETGSQLRVEATTYMSIAMARLNARQGIKLVAWLTSSALLVLALLLVFFYLLADVFARREEIGMFLAVGFGPGRLVSMFLVKLVTIAVVGAILGFALGTLGVVKLPVGSYYEKAAIRPVTVMITLPLSVLGALFISTLAGVLPVLAAVRTDPAEVLRKN